MMPSRVLHRSFWTPVVITFCALIVLGMVVLAASVSSFVAQQHRSDKLARQTALLSVRTCRAEQDLRAFVLALALNQPNLDRHVLQVAIDLLRDLPKTCVP